MSKPRRVRVGKGVSQAAVRRFSGVVWAWAVFALAACGGEEKQANSPGTCPEGTVLTGTDCVPDSARSNKSTDDDSPKGGAKANASPSSASSANQGSAADDLEGGGPSYDKDAVEAQLRRAAKQIKDNCGSASDEEGNKTGPWGSTSPTIVLGRNGHVLDVKVPSPYSGKPVGDCVVNSFKRIQFPPYAGSTDASVSWDVQIVQPKHVAEPKHK